MLDVEHVLAQIAEVLYTTRATQRHSFDIARETVNNGIAGDIVECGIAAGGNFASMIVGALPADRVDQWHRKFWGFDSFQGIQLAGPKDGGHQPGIGPITHDVNVPEESLLVSSGVTVHSAPSVVENMHRWGLGDANIEFVEGWVQHTLPMHSESVGPIAVLRLDMDVYAPTRCALEHLWPKVVPGGVVIIDDWELDGARRAFVEYLKTQELDYQHMQTPRYPGEEHQGYFVKPGAT